MLEYHKRQLTRYLWIDDLEISKSKNRFWHILIVATGFCSRLPTPWEKGFWHCHCPEVSPTLFQGSSQWKPEP